MKKLFISSILSTLGCLWTASVDEHPDENKDSRAAVTLLENKPVSPAAVSIPLYVSLPLLGLGGTCLAYFLYHRFKQPEPVKNIQPPKIEEVVVLPKPEGYDDLSGLKYAIHFLWVNKKQDPEQIYLFPLQHRGVVLKDMLQEWARLNQGYSIYLWYDSAFATEKQIEDTRSLLGKAVEIKDIRTLETVKTHLDVFEDKIPLYFRVDLLKMILTLHQLQTEPDRYFIFSDLDVVPMSKEDLFDPWVLYRLDQFHILFSGSHQKVPMSAGFENFFHMAKAGNPNLLKAIEEGMINLNIARVKKNTMKDTRGATYAQAVYCSIPLMFAYFYSLNRFIEAKEDDLKYYLDLTNPQKPSCKLEFDIKVINPLIGFTRNGSLSIPTRSVQAASVSNQYE